MTSVYSVTAEFRGTSTFLIAVQIKLVFASQMAIDNVEQCSFKILIRKFVVTLSINLVVFAWKQRRILRFSI